MKFSFLPREEQYFDLIDQAVHYLVEGAAALNDLANHFENVEEKIHRINGIEHACDEICHTTLEKLDKSFITPIDREDIHTLIIRLDDVLDMMNNSASRMIVFGVKKPRPPVTQLTNVILEQTKSVQSAINLLRYPKKYDAIGVHCIEIHRLENDADEIIREAIMELFRNETNAIELLRWKEIYEALETVTDCAEDAANVIQGITVKMA